MVTWLIWSCDITKRFDWFIPALHNMYDAYVLDGVGSESIKCIESRDLVAFSLESFQLGYIKCSPNYVYSLSLMRKECIDKNI